MTGVRAPTPLNLRTEDFSADDLDLQRLFQQLNQRLHRKALRFLRSNSRPSRVVREKHSAPSSLELAIQRARIWSSCSRASCSDCCEEASKWVDRTLVI